MLFAGHAVRLNLPMSWLLLFFVCLLLFVLRDLWVTKEFRLLRPTSQDSTDPRKEMPFWYHRSLQRFWKSFFLLYLVLINDVVTEKICPAKFGYFPDPTDCQGYYICTFGNAKTRKCGGGLHYKTTTQTCDTPKADNCVQDGDQASRPKYSGPMMKTNDNAPAPPITTAPPAADDQQNAPVQQNTNQAPAPEQQIDIPPPPEDNFSLPALQPKVTSKTLIDEQDSTGLTQQASRAKSEYVPAPPASTTVSHQVQKPTFGPVRTTPFKDKSNASKTQTIKPASSDKSTAKAPSTSIAKPEYSDAVRMAFNSKPSFGKKKVTVPPPTLPPPPPMPAPTDAEPDSPQGDGYKSDRPPLDFNPDNNPALQQNFDGASHPLREPTRNPASASTGQKGRRPVQNLLLDQSQAASPDGSQNNWPQSQEDPRGNVDDGVMMNKKPNKRWQTQSPDSPADIPVPLARVKSNTPQKTRLPQNSFRDNWEKRQQFDTDSIAKAASQSQMNPPEQNTNRDRSRPKSSLPPRLPERKLRPATKARPSPPPQQIEESRCSADICQPPDCQCGSLTAPGGLPLSDVPQMVLLSFDAEINERNLPIYEQIFHKSRKNPNGCNIKATFFVSHEFTNYGMVRYLYEKGHEIGSHSITHGVGTGFKDEKSWETEMTGEKGFLASFASIRPDDIKGARAPLLGGGGDDQFTALQNGGFVYDSTLTTPTTSKAPYWPYTLDFGVPHACAQQPCPQGSYRGFWELPLNPIYGLFGESCYEADRCTFGSTGDEVYKLLYNNFYDRYYSTNKAPFQLAIHADWLKFPPHREAFERFLDLVSSMPDVWVVTGGQAVAWMQNPTPITQLSNFSPWSCSADDASRLPQCETINACPLPFRDRLRYFYTCSECPAEFPWRPEI